MGHEACISPSPRFGEWCLTGPSVARIVERAAAAAGLDAAASTRALLLARTIARYLADQLPLLLDGPPSDFSDPPPSRVDWYEISTLQRWRAARVLPDGVGGKWDAELPVLRCYMTDAKALHRDLMKALLARISRPVCHDIRRVVTLAWAVAASGPRAAGAAGVRSVIAALFPLLLL